MARKTSFYYSFFVLPGDERRAIIAVWDFCRAVDDAVDEEVEGGTMPAREAVVFWRDELARCYRGAAPETPQGRRSSPASPNSICRGRRSRCHRRVSMDLDQTRYETFDDLFGYCRRVASAVGMICIRIFRCQSPGAADYALHLGVALQLTNILRDVKGDLEQGRVYLPQEDMRAFGCTEDELARGLVSDSVRQLIAFECRRAHDFYRRAVAARPPEDRRRLVAAEIMRAVYFETLQRIEQNGYDVFSKPTRVPKPVQAAIALREWLFPS